MKHLKNIEEKLREKLPPMRNEFRRDLRARLLQQAEGSFSEKNWMTSVLSLIPMTMKRYSVAVLATLTVFVFVLTSVIKTPLEPQEVLAKALENYEQQTNGIRHEKRLDEVYQDGKFISSTLTESYEDEIGNSLLIQMNPKTEEIESVDLTQVDEFGDVVIYGPSLAGFFGKDFFDLDPEQKRKQDILRGEKIYCVEKLEYENNQAEVELLLAKEDYSTYVVRGGVGSKINSDPAAYKQDIDALFSLQGSSKSGFVDGRKYINTLIQSNSYDYSQIREGKKVYYLFKVPFYLNDSETWFYIDSQTYQLSHYETYSASKSVQHKQKVTLLINEFIDESQASKVFTPDQFDLLNGVQPIFLGYSIPFKVEASGCFDFQGNRLVDNFFEELSAEIKWEWNKIMNDVQSTAKNDYKKDMDEFDDKNDLPFDPKNVQMPSKTNILQGYEKGVHESWNFSGFTNDGGSVYTPLNGIVLEVNEGWNSGYGNSILIEHEIEGVKIQTHYGHLHDFKVRVGQKVKAGDVIARMGQTGDLYGGGPYFLNFELRYEGQKLDPTLIYEEGALLNFIQSHPDQNSKLAYEPPHVWAMNEVEHSPTGVIELKLDLGLPPAQMPLEGVLTQAYQGTHLGWDFTPEEGGDLSVYTVLPGKVIQANEGWNGGYGNMVVVDHGNGLQSLYAHLDKITVSEEQRVLAGEQIGIVGNTGNVEESEGSYLHFEVRKDGVKSDPASLF